MPESFKRKKIKEKNQYSCEPFVMLLTQNIKALFFANVFFAVPLIISALIVFLIGSIIGQFNIFIATLPVILTFPFFAGVIQITKDITKGTEVHPLKTFIKGVKNNYKLFILHGVLIYAAVFSSIFSIAFYLMSAKTNNSMYFMFIFSTIITIILLFAIYFAPLITVTVDISIKHVYKNALLMAFGELPANLLVTLFLAILGFVFFTFYLILASNLIGLIVFILIAILIVPSTASLIITSKLYPKVKKLLNSDSSDEASESNERESLPENKFESSAEAGFAHSHYENKESECNNTTQNKPSSSHKKNGDDYVYHNGKMVKRSELYQQ
ncbi:hypothetical protein AGMMS50284_4640 [Clostridia bacterium]|nr:hypothetical protein AGMMS50284_4640 [Clostridia bacterium]